MAMEITKGASISWVTTSLDFVFQDEVVGASALDDWNIGGCLWQGKKDFHFQVSVVDSDAKKYRFYMKDTFGLPLGELKFIITAIHKTTGHREQSTVDTVNVVEGPPKV